ncbi:Region found in RelA / SpoT proteins [seawater metagenome]|uniref:Region found in RelA / SpoT proteins n=1 Tax=seawater metagenome TaxID=1561972 RepID=A0A5E8CLD2_9ZZZZ
MKIFVYLVKDNELGEIFFKNDYYTYSFIQDNILLISGKNVKENRYFLNDEDTSNNILNINIIPDLNNVNVNTDYPLIYKISKKSTYLDKSDIYHIINPYHMISNLLNILEPKISNALIYYRIKKVEKIIKKIELQKRIKDIIGFKILLDGKWLDCLDCLDCYKTKEILMKDLDIKTVKNYISEPKPNKYRALHLLGTHDTIDYEIQIVTVKMNLMNPIKKD